MRRFPMIDQSIRVRVQLLQGGWGIVGLQILVEHAVLSQPSVRLAVRRRMRHAPHFGTHHGVPLRSTESQSAKQ